MRWTTSGAIVRDDDIAPARWQQRTCRNLWVRESNSSPSRTAGEPFFVSSRTAGVGVFLPLPCHVCGRVVFQRSKSFFYLLRASSSWSEMPGRLRV